MIKNGRPLVPVEVGSGLNPVDGGTLHGSFSNTFPPSSQLSHVLLREVYLLCEGLPQRPHRKRPTGVRPGDTEDQANSPPLPVHLPG